MREVILLEHAGEEQALFGRQNHTVRRLKDALGVRVFARQGEVIIEGDPEAAREAARILMGLLEKIRVAGDLTEEDIDRSLDRASVAQLKTDGIVRSLDGTWITPRSDGQKRYLAALRERGITIAVGPAGTGKTYLAVAMAVACLRQEMFRKLVLARPAVEAGEKLGFLPGDLLEKVNPYLRPLYDALGDLIEFSQLQRFKERDVIEIVPLAFMRGRTLDNAYIILDEAQNTTPEQMKMFLTRMGRNSAIVATGDITQIDLPAGHTSGLIDAIDVLSEIPGVRFVYLEKEDIVRHELVQEIVHAYAQRDARRAGAGAPEAGSGGK